MLTNCAECGKLITAGNGRVLSNVPTLSLHGVHDIYKCSCGWEIPLSEIDSSSGLGKSDTPKTELTELEALRKIAKHSEESARHLFFIRFGIAVIVVVLLGGFTITF